MHRHERSVDGGTERADGRGERSADGLTGTDTHSGADAGADAHADATAGAAGRRLR